MFRNQFILGNVWNPVFGPNDLNSSGNDFDTDNRAFVPEVWANEALMTLEDNIVAANLVYRDFEDQIAEYGDTVNAYKPGVFTAKSKVDGTDITLQPATATKVPVVLNKHLHTSFIIHDRELSLAQPNLIAKYLIPAIRSIAKGLDDIVIAQKYQFIANSVGKLGTAPTKAEVIALQTLMDTNLVPNDPGDRVCLVTSATKGALLNIEHFTDASMIADGGRAVHSGALANYFGTDFLMTTNNRVVNAGNTVDKTFLIDLAAGYAAGTTGMAVKTGTGAISVGSWITIAGDMTPQRVTATTEVGADTRTITVSPGLKYAVANGAVVTVYTPGSVDLAAGYDAGYALPMTVADFTVAPQTGQLVSLGAVCYGSMPLGKTAANAVIDPTTSLQLDRPLEAAAANNALIGVGPAGNYNWAFNRNAVALVTRPLALPPAGSGVQSAIVNANGLSIRLVMGYNQIKQGMIVTADCLCGVKTLDTSLGALLLG